jgi:hypothetical protein
VLMSPCPGRRPLVSTGAMGRSTGAALVGAQRVD